MKKVKVMEWKDLDYYQKREVYDRTAYMMMFKSLADKKYMVATYLHPGLFDNCLNIIRAEVV